MGRKPPDQAETAMAQARPVGSIPKLIAVAMPMGAKTNRAPMLAPVSVAQALVSRQNTRVSTK